MMIKLLKKISDHNIYLDLVDGELKLFSENGDIDHDLLHEIKSRKEEIILFLVNNKKNPAKGVDNSIPVVSQRNSYPVSHAQKRLWLLTRNEANSVAYNMPNSLLLQGQYDMEVFSRAVQAVIARHEILRTVFIETPSGEVHQRVLAAESPELKIGYVDYSSSEDGYVLAQDNTAADALKVFDLEQGPLIRTCMIRVTKEQYMFYYNMHHIITDGWSMDVLARDVLAYYKAFLENGKPSLPSLRIQYKDYASWQLSLLKNGAIQGEHYWQKQFKGNIPLLDFPAWKPRPRVKTFTGQNLVTVISAERTACLRSFCNAEGGTLFMGLLTLWNALSFRYTGQQDIIIGSPVAGRDHYDLEDQIGFYVNTLALRNWVEPEESFRSLFRTVKTNTLSAFAHQSYPFDRVVENIDQPFQINRNALFDVVLVLQNQELKGEGESGAVFSGEEIRNVGSASALFDITVSFKESGDHLLFQLTYNSDVYDQEVMEGLMRHFKQLGDSLLFSPDVRLGEIDYLSETEREQQLFSFNNTESAYPAHTTVTSLFREQAVKYPHRTALISGNTILSYKSLDQKTDALAGYLQVHYGVTDGDRISICLERSHLLIVSVLGVLKAGGCYIPIDAHYPQERKKHMQEDSLSRLLIDDAFMSAFMEEENKTFLSSRNEQPPADALAYIMYTSGSTGKPKGVMVSHRSIVRLVRNTNYYSFSTDDVLLATGSFSFDATTFEFWGPLLNGGCLVLCSREVLLDSLLLSSEIRKHSVNLMWFTSGWLNQLVDSNIELFAHLKTIITGGDRLSPLHISRLKSRFPELIIINGYGPTENTTFSLTHKIEEAITGDIPLGHPISNSSVYVLDMQNKLVPLGVTGEIHVGGAGLALGYCNLPELTSERFIPHPAQPGELIYKTGDLGRWNPDFRLVFQGRADHQIKIRGHRIELGEIEERLLSVPGVRKGIAVAPQWKREKVIAVFFESEEGTDKKMVRKMLAADLPDYMLPGYYIKMDRIPLSSNGKVDREKLPAVQETDAITEEYVEAGTDNERVILSVWSEVLQRTGIGIRDNFYSIGGDSIKAIQVVSRLRQMGYRIKIEQILRTPVLEELAPLLAPDTIVIDQEEVSGDVSLTPIQYDFFYNPAIKNKQHFNQSVLIKGVVALDYERLAKCLRALVAHHDALRMRYYAEGDKMMQVNQKVSAVGLDLQYVDLRDEDNPVAEMKTVTAALQSGINLSLGSLHKAAYFRLKDGDRLLIIIHHLVVDGISWRIILEDLSTLYQQMSGDKSVNLPLKTDSFKRWASLIEEYAGTDIIDDEQCYWEKLNGEEIQPLPYDVNGANKTAIHIDDHQSFVVEEAITELLQGKMHQVYHTEINDVLLAALGLALRDIFGLERSIIKLEGHGREDLFDDADISRTVGWFTSIFPFLLEHPVSHDAKSALVHTKEALRKVPRKGIGYGILAQHKQNFNAKFKPALIFNYLGDFGRGVSNQHNPVFEYAPEVLGYDSDDQNSTDCSVMLSGMISFGELIITVHYSQKHHSASQIARFVESYKAYLRQTAEEVTKIEGPVFTPSDMTYKGLSISQFEKLNAGQDVADVYLLSPLQQSMYYHWLAAPHSAAYYEQLSYRLTLNSIEVANVKAAYDQLIRRYAVLRTRFTSELEGIPLQIVYKSVTGDLSIGALPAALEDKEMEAWISSYKQQDRAKGFELEQHRSQMRLRILDLNNGKYEFIWSFHHILMDGWCISILINDFYKLLKAELYHEIVDLPAPKPYSNYISWLDKVAKNKSLQYWKTYLSGYENLISIPFKHPDIQENEFASGHKKIVIKGDAFRALDDFCKEINVTHNTFLQGVWGYLLCRYNRTDDVVFGAVVSGRPGELAGVEDMVGLFINTIPVRLRFTSEDTPRTLLIRLHDEAIESQSHHYLNLSEVQAVSALGGALIDHVIVFENYPVQDLIVSEGENTGNLEELVVEQVQVFEQTNYDFDITAYVSERAFEIKLDFNSKAYDPDAVDRMAEHLRHLIDQFCLRKEQNLHSFNYITPEEEQKLLFEFNNTDKSFSLEETFLDVFAAQVRQHPSKTAIITAGTDCTYTDLDQLSDELASFLQDKHELKSGDIVAVKLERSEWLVISILALFKIGAAYLPIDPSYPSKRVDYLLHNSRCSYVIEEEDLEAFRRLEIRETQTNRAKIDGTHLAYVIYTSGSTGNPKGVMIEHAGMLNHLYAMVEVMQLDTDSIIVQNAPSTFDISVWQLLNALVCGGTTSIYNQLVVLNPERFLERVKAEGVTVLQVVPSYLKALLDAETISKTKHLDNLSYLLVTGEAISKTLLDHWFIAYPSVKVINAYGPAEASDDVTLHIMSHTPPHSLVPVGKPIRNMAVHILDDNLQLCGIDIEGQICISGIGLARGYLHMPELSASNFVANPFKKEESLYISGDVGKWLKDGTVAFIGRKDDQVKIRGHRIELGEIQHQLQLMKGIQEAVVIAKTVEANTRELVAYVVGDQTVHPEAIRRHLSRLLPDYMIPSRYIKLDTIPLTANGKIDKSILASLTEKNLMQEDYVEPKTKEEQVLASVCANVLKRERISLRDNFYTIGGDSIKSIQIVSRLKQEGYILKIDQILRTPVIAELAKLLRTGTLLADQSEVTGAVDLTPVQCYFFESPYITNRNHYNQSVLLKCRQRVETGLLERCLQRLMAHHDALRMRFTPDKDEWKQYNQDARPGSYAIAYHDLRGAADEQESLLGWCTALQADLDITSGPLVSAGHFRLWEEDRVQLVIHHLVVDGVSWRILLEDLSALYQAGVAGISEKLPLKTDSFRSWSLALSRYAKTDRVQKEQEYWEKISNEAVPPFPSDTGNLADVFHYDQIVSFALDNHSTEKLQTKAQQAFSTEMNDVLLTGLALAVRHVFGMDKSIVEMEGHGREDIIEGIDISRTVGWFTSVYPFVLDISVTRTLKESLVKTKELLRNVPDKGIGYGITRYLNGGFKPSVTPAITFNYLGTFDYHDQEDKERPFTFASESAGPESAAENGHPALLDVSGVLFNGVLNISVKYDSGFYRRATIERFKSAYHRYLRELIDDLTATEETWVTPSDLTFNRLSIAELTEINVDNTVEDVYELSPLQQGMYYFWLFNEETSLYFEQTSYTLDAKGLNVDGVLRAYDLLVARYPVLRTRFSNNYGNVPLQIVHKSVPGNFRYHELPPGISAEAYAEQIREADKAEGFNLETPSQMRLIVLNFGQGKYEFIWSHHHILMDGWCMSILINDFYHILNGITRNLPIALPEPVKYSRYIHWLSGLDKQGSLSYWKEYLEGFGKISELPFKYLSAEGAAYVRGRKDLVLDAALFERIAFICRQEGITLNTFVQSVWGSLLAAYNNTRDVVVGAIVSGRPGELAGVENMVGLFINTIPVRVRFKKDDTPRLLLKRIHEEAIKGSAHHYVSLSEVQAFSEFGQDLIDHILIFENYPVQDLIRADVNSSQDLHIESVSLFDQTNYDFNLTCEGKGDALKFSFEYNGAIYDEHSIELMIGHFRQMTEQFCYHPDRAISFLNYMTETEKNKILRFNPAPDTYPREKTIIDLFEEQVDENLDKVAVAFNGKTLTYKELNVLSDGFAQYLQVDFRVLCHDKVAIELDKSEWMIACILAVLKCGAAYIPIDPLHPEELKKYILADSGAKLCIKKEHVLQFTENKIAYNSGRVNAASAEDPAYIIYTSGSTGMPKGVLVSHRSVGNLRHGYEKCYGLGKFEVKLLQLASFSFDVSVGDICRSLLMGGTMILCPSETKLDVHALAGLLTDNNISIFEGTPSLVLPLMHYVHNRKLDVSSLKMIILGGESLSLKDYRFLTAHFGTKRIINSYGVTEATVDSTYYEHGVEPGTSVVASTPIGIPFPNVRMYVLNEDNALVPEGVYGEICIGGDSIAAGYLNREELTASKFIPDPFQRGQRLYKTGDFGRWLPGGIIEFAGRMDSQVKVNGYRIELGEIEYQLQSKADIREAVLLVRKNSESNQELVAYFTADTEQKTPELRSFLMERLPSYMCPTWFVQLPFMPLNVNGKIDKKALPDHQQTGTQSAVPYSAPQNQMEELILDIIASELGYAKEKIGVSDNFFDLGINSIKLLKVLGNINSRLHRQIKPVLLFEYPNVRDLVKHAINTSNKGEAQVGPDKNIADEIDDILSLMED